MGIFGFDRSQSPRRVSLVLAAGGAALAAAAMIAGPTATAQDAQLQPLTFTADQVSRGASTFDRNCSACHGEELGGLDGGPALKGEFFEGWFAGTVGDLFDYVSTAMPADNPGALSVAQYVNLIAFILSENGFVAGDVALPEEPEALALIGFAQPE